MSPIDFNPNLPPPSDPDKDSEARERRVDEQKQTEQSAVFKQALAKKGAPGSGPLPYEPPPTAAKQALKQAKEQTTGAAAQYAAAKSGETQTAKTLMSAQVGGAAGAAGGAPMSAKAATSEKPAATTAKAASEGDAESTDATPGGGGATGATGAYSASSSSRSLSDAANQGTQNQTGGGGGGDSGNPGTSDPSSATKAAAHDASRPDRKAAARSQDAPRIDLASIVPSFPIPVAAQQAAAPTPAAPHPIMTSAQIQQMVAFAMVGRDAAGNSEFHLGLAGSLTGVGVHLTAMGKRRVRLRLTGLDENDAIGDAEVSQLVASLRSREIDVVEVLMS